MTDAPVLCDLDRRGVATVTLNRPQVNNAYDGALIDGLIETFARLAADAALRCVVVRGAGRHFQAGADLKFLDAMRRAPPAANHDFSRRTLAAMRGLQEFPRPTIALIHGGCFGGGVGIAAACDIAIAADDALFALTEVRWGVTPAPIVPLLVDRIGARATGRYALTAERFDAAEARRIGLVHATCAADALATEGARIVEALLMAAPEAVALTKRLTAEAVETGLTPSFERRVVDAAAACRRTEEAEEGLRSFAEKRLPRWYPQ